MLSYHAWPFRSAREKLSCRLNLALSLLPWFGKNALYAKRAFYSVQVVDHVFNNYPSRALHLHQCTVRSIQGHPQNVTMRPIRDQEAAGYRYQATSLWKGVV